MSRTYATLALSSAAWTEVRDKLVVGGYSTKLLPDGTIDMEGLAVVESKDPATKAVDFKRALGLANKLVGWEGVDIATYLARRVDALSEREALDLFDALMQAGLVQTRLEYRPREKPSVWWQRLRRAVKQEEDPK